MPGDVEGGITPNGSELAIAESDSPLESLEQTRQAPPPDGRNETALSQVDGALGAPPQRSRRRTRIRAVVLAAVGSLIMVAGFVLYAVLPNDLRDYGLSIAVPPLFALLSLIAGAGIHKLARSRGYRATTAEELLNRDTRPPVLYLRSFSDDPVASARTPLGLHTEEEQMAAVLRRIGPVIALGTAGESLRALGAARDYVPAERWKEWVLAKLRVASLTVFRASNTDAFWWEVAIAAKHVPPDRLAFLLPRDEGKYSVFRARITEHFPAAASLPLALPRLDPRVGSKLPDRSLWGLLYFDQRGAPQIRSIAQQAPTVRDAIALVLSSSVTQPYRSRFESLFNPLLQHAGGRTTPTPQLVGMIGFLAGFYVLVPIYAWNRRKGRPALGPQPLDQESAPEPPDVRDS